MPMYNLLEWSSDGTGSLWGFFSKDEATNFSANVASNNTFNFFD